MSHTLSVAVIQCAAFLVLLPGCSSNVVYKNASAPVEERVQDLLSRMTVEEKAAMLGGSGWMETQANQRLGIPSIKMSDGPVGVRSWHAMGVESAEEIAKLPPVKTTAFPSGAALAATWDTDLAVSEGQALGQQSKALGRDMLLGPTVNINRIPVWGRNFEGFGEDPYLASRIAVGYVKGLQGEGIIATVKHFAANNQEYERHRVDVQVDERTLNEIYFPAFKAAVQEAGALAVMSAYNKVNGAWCAENPFLLTDILKTAWGFKGFVVSDWGSTYSTTATVNAGLSLEMPGGPLLGRFLAMPDVHDAGFMGGYLLRDKVLAGLKSGQVHQAAVDDSVRRMLRVMFTAGLFDKPKPGGGEVDTPAQRAVARRAATESVVLLKNMGGMLPLDIGRIKSVAVIGPNAADVRHGGGSSEVNSNYKVAPLDGIKESAGPHAQVGYALGVAMEAQEKGETPAARMQKIAEAVALAKKSDAAVVFVGYSAALESEDFDRKSMDLPAGQDELISAVAAANPKTAVVVVAGAPVTMTKWLGKVPAVLMQFYGGQEAGHAIADVLFGAANPSGKLPVTFPKQFSDSPAAAYYPGSKDNQLKYGEGIYVGYRGFDKEKTAPLFPFGHGLSYTTFEYKNLHVTPNAEMGKAAEVRLDIHNSGTREGAEVVQVYVRDAQSSLDRPLKELKAFRRVNLRAGETREVAFTLDQAAMSFYDPAMKGWVAEPGAFEVWVGSSSSDIRLKGSFQLRPLPDD